VAVSGYLAVYQIVATRGADQAKRLLGEHYAGILGTDRWSAYTWVPARRRQVCWSHLRRDFQAMVDRNDAGSEVGQDLLNYSDVLFDYWYKVRDGTRPGKRKWKDTRSNPCQVCAGRPGEGQALRGRPV
jgi:transposase